MGTTTNDATSGTCTGCAHLVQWDESVGALIDDAADQFCPDGERHAFPHLGI